MALLDDVINDIQLQKNKDIRVAQESYVRHFGYQFYKDLLTYEVHDNPNAFDSKSVELSYIRLVNKSIKKNIRVQPDDISTIVFKIPKEAKQ